MLSFDAEAVKQEVRNTFRYRLKALREEIGVTQAEFAKEMGVSRAAIGYYESGERLPDISFIRAISVRTGCSLDYLVGGGKKVQVSNAIFNTVNLSDSQQEILVSLLYSDTFQALLRDEKFLDIVGEVDIIANLGLGGKLNEIPSMFVSQRAAAHFTSIIDQVYRDVDANQHAAKSSVYGEETLEYIDKNNNALIIAVQEFMKAHENMVKSQIMSRNPPNIIDIIKAKSAAVIDDKFEEYKRELLHLAGGYAPSVMSKDLSDIDE